MIKVLSLSLLVLVAAGCAGSSINEPTHRWAADVPKDRVTYHNDHARCQAQAGLSGENKLETSSVQFDQYSQCMTDQGYQLTAYNE